jgi:hypothetical protein
MERISPVEGEGLEPSVPRKRDNAFRDCAGSTTHYYPPDMDETRRTALTRYGNGGYYWRTQLAMAWWDSLPRDT